MRAQTIQDMRTLLDFVEAHPDIPMPYFGQVDAFAGKENLRTIAKAMSPATKKSEGDFFMLTRRFGSVNLEVNFPRDEVCERVEVGKKVVPAVPKHEEPLYEWKCPDSILAPT